MQKHPLVDIRDTIHETAQEFVHYHHTDIFLATIIDRLGMNGKPRAKHVKKYIDPKQPIPWEYLSNTGLQYDGSDILMRKAIVEARIGFVTGSPCSNTKWQDIDAHLKREHSDFSQEVALLGETEGPSSSGRHVNHVGIEPLIPPINYVRIAVGYYTQSEKIADLLFHFLRFAIHTRVQYFKQTGQLVEPE